MADEYIKREAAIRYLQYICKILTVREEKTAADILERYAIKKIANKDAIPTADVRPVVRGRWEWNHRTGYYYCSNCKAVSPREDQHGEYCDCPDFCHRCGADMRGGYE